MHELLRRWLDGDEKSQFSVDWLDFAAIYGFIPPADYRSFVECCGFGLLGAQWAIGVCVPKAPTMEDVVELKRNATLGVWTETDPDEPPIYDIGRRAFISLVRRLQPFAFATDNSGRSRVAAWSRTEENVDDWPVLIINLSEGRLEYAAANFRYFVAACAAGKSWSDMFVLEDGESADDWEPDR